MDPYRDNDQEPEPPTGNRGGVVAAIVIGAIVLVIVVLHLTGGMALHGS